jgi:hypothetical protein
MNRARCFWTTGNLDEALYHAKVLTHRCFTPLMYSSYGLMQAYTARQHCSVSGAELDASGAASTYSMLVESDVYHGLHGIIA